MSFAGIDNTSSATVGGTPALEDFTSQTASVNPDGNYPIEVQGNTDGGYTAKITVYIDWNQDGFGLFDSSIGSNEKYNLPDIVGSTGVDGIKSEGFIQVPATALLGNTRMRVIKKFSSVAEPCNTAGYGQAEDYSVAVTAAGAWDCPDIEANIGDVCDDGDPLTENDVITADCECVGTPVGDVGCINSSRYPFNTPSLATPDLVTINEFIYLGDYSEVTGIISGYEYQFSGVVNSTVGAAYITLRSGSVDGPVIAAGFSPLTITASSDDNIFIHWNVDADCGTSSDFTTGTGLCVTCATVVDCEGVVGGTALPGTSCDDGDDTTVNDMYDADCNCAGEPAAVGSVCSSAIAIACDEDAVTHSSAASNGTNTTACSMGDNGLWFSFMGTGGDITVNSSATFDHEISINSGSCDDLTSIVCQDLSTGAENYTIQSSVNGEMYYVYIASWASESTTTGDITIGIECATPPVCLSPELTLTTQDADGAPIDGCIEGGSQYYVLATLSGGEGNDSYNVSANGGDVVELDAYGSTVFGPYTAGTTVNVFAEGAQDDDCDVSGSINPDICPPSNDDCATAIAIVCNADPETYSSIGSTATNTTTCSFGNAGLWFTFTGDGNDITFKSIATFDHAISINTGSCDDLTNVGCTDSPAGIVEKTITIENSVEGETYYVYVAHWSTFISGTGDITVSIECEEAPFDCPDLEANIGDVCFNDAGEEGVIDENCECYVAIVYDCPAIEANFGDACVNDAGEEGVIDENCECFVPVVYDCPAIEANFGDVCHNDAGEEGVIDENCECFVPVVYDCPEIEANIGDDCIIEGTEDVGLINDACECVPVSTTNLTGFNFTMYPNPAGSNESVTLTSNQSIDRYEILDITGKLIDAQIILNQNEITIALRNYSAGMYILKAYSGSAFSTQKMVVR